MESRAVQSRHTRTIRVAITPYLPSRDVTNNDSGVLLLNEGKCDFMRRFPARNDAYNGPTTVHVHTIWTSFCASKVINYRARLIFQRLQCLHWLPPLELRNWLAQKTSLSRLYGSNIGRALGLKREVLDNSLVRRYTVSCSRRPRSGTVRRGRPVRGAEWLSCTQATR
jgi:hypothetical protein